MQRLMQRKSSYSTRRFLGGEIAKAVGDIITCTYHKSLVERRAESLKDIATKKKGLIETNALWRCLRKEGKAQVFGIYLHQIIEGLVLLLCMR